MKNKPQEIIEASCWLYPAVALSGWLSPVILLVNVVLEIVKTLF